MSLSSQDLALLFDHHVVPTFVLDRRGKVIIWNRACEALTGLGAQDVLGTADHWRGFYEDRRPCLADLILEDRIEAADELYCCFSDVQFSHGAIGVENWCLLPLTKRRLYLGFEANIIRDAHGAVGVLETVRDLSAVKAAEARLQDLAALDALTGIANRRTFNDILTAEWRRAARAGAYLSLLLIDIDQFKQFNDTLGHQRGDECLKTVAQTIAGAVCRAGDAPARFGGEEFAIVLPATDIAGAVHIAESVRAAVADRTISHPGSAISPHVTVSIGVATLRPTSTDCADRLIMLADSALYQAKKLGRNRVCEFTKGFDCASARNGPAAMGRLFAEESEACAHCLGNHGGKMHHGP